MANLLLRIYGTLQRMQLIGAMLLLTLTGLLIWSALRLNIEEDITRTLPCTDGFVKYENLNRNSAISGNVVIGIGPRAAIGDAAIAAIRERIADGCRNIDTTLVREVRFGSDASALSGHPQPIRVFGDDRIR